MADEPIKDFIPHAKTVPSKQLEREERQRRRRKEQKRKEEIAQEVAAFVPKPLPHTEGFIVHPDWEVAEKDAKGKPSVYVDNLGVRHYAPGSTMWNMGYRTSTEYRGYREVRIDPETGEERAYRVGGGAVSDSPKSKAPWVAMKDARGKPVHVAKRDYAKILRLSDKPKAQFNFLVALDIIPAGSKFVPNKKNPQDWGYISPGKTQVKQVEVGEKEEKAPHLSSFVNKDNELNLTAAVAAGYTKASDYEGWKVTQYQLDTLVKDLKNREDAKETLDKYHIYGNTYNTAKALVDDDPKVKEALKVLFSQSDLEKTQRWIDKHWGVGERVGGEAGKKIVKFYRKLTPWAEGKGETFISEAGKIKQKLPIPTVLAPAVAPVIATPVPHDDAVLWLLVGGAVAYTSIKYALENKKTVPVPTNISDASKRFRGAFNRSVTPKDVVVVGADGMAASIYELDPKRYTLGGLNIVKLKRDIPGLVPPRADYKLPPYGIIDVSKRLPGVSTKKVEPAIYLPTPKVSMDDLTGQKAGVIKAVAGVAVAEQALKKALPQTMTIPSHLNWNKILEQAQQAQKRKEINEAFAKLNAFVTQSDLTQRSRHHYRRAYNEYLRRRAMLEAAKHQYIASLNPTPIKGKASNETASIFALYLLAQELGLDKQKANESTASYFDRVLGEHFKSISQTANTTLNKLWTAADREGVTEKQLVDAIATTVLTQVKLKFKTLTKAQIKSLAQTITKAAAKQALATQTATKAVTKAAAKVATRTAVATKVAVKPAVATKAITKVAAATAKAVTQPVPIPPVLYLPLPAGASDKKKREVIKKTPGTVTWNMGKLGRDPQDIWHVRLPDGRHIVVRGKAPEGAKILADGPRSAYKTAQVIGPKRRAFPAIRQTHGAVTATIKRAKTPKGARISFTSGRPRSIKRGRLYHTKMGRARPISRRPLGRRRR